MHAVPNYVVTGRGYAVAPFAGADDASRSFLPWLIAAGAVGVAFWLKSKADTEIGSLTRAYRRAAGDDPAEFRDYGHEGRGWLFRRGRA